jgi:hypothetical protein
MPGKLISVTVSNPDLIRSVDTIREAKISLRKGTMKIFFLVFVVLNSLLIFFGARKKLFLL